jgi:hypothetical protein
MRGKESSEDSGIVAGLFLERGARDGWVDNAKSELLEAVKPPQA